MPKNAKNQSSWGDAGRSERPGFKQINNKYTRTPLSSCNNNCRNSPPQKIEEVYFHPTQADIQFHKYHQPWRMYQETPKGTHKAPQPCNPCRPFTTASEEPPEPFHCKHGFGTICTYTICTNVYIYVYVYIYIIQEYIYIYICETRH